MAQTSMESNGNGNLQWSRDRILGFVVGVLLFIAVVSVVSPVETDIAMYWQAAHRIFDQGEDPYILRPGDRLLMVYPPTAFVLLYPFSELDVAQSSTLMLTVNLVLAVIRMVVIISDLSRDDPSRRLVLWGPLYMAAFDGLYLNIVFCQINLIFLGFLWLYWRQVRSFQNTFSSGGALMLGCMAKPHYSLLALGAGPNPGYRIIVGAAITSAALVGASLVLAPDGSWGSWVDRVLSEIGYTALPGGRSSIAAPWNRSIPGFVGRFFIPNKYVDPVSDSPATASLLSMMLILILLAVSAWAISLSMGNAERKAKDRDLELSLISVFVFLESPASWTHHLVVLLPAALILLRDVVLDRDAVFHSRLTVRLTLAVIAFTFDDMIPREVRTSSLAIMSLMTVAVVSLWLLIVAQLVRRSAPHHHVSDSVRRSV